MSLGNTVKFMALIAGMFCFQSFFVGDETMTKEDGMYVVNTTTIGKDIEGYNGPTPLKVYIKTSRWSRLSTTRRSRKPCWRNGTVRR